MASLCHHQSSCRRSMLAKLLVVGLISLVFIPTSHGFVPGLQQSRPSVPFLSGQSPRTALSATDIPKEWQGEVLRVLKEVIDPDLNADIVTLGFVQDLQLDQSDDDKTTVSFNVELTTPACPVKDQFAADCQRLVESLDWIDQANVVMTAQEVATETDTLGMAQVGSVIAVSSCKGGVGKSTTAVNLAFALQQQGATVGILDADVYGPSLPTMVTPDDEVVRFVGTQIAPLQRNGVRLMSFGFVNDGSAVMRGPMISQLLEQFLSVTQWGRLDYLLLDMPPGTGDVQLTLTQRLNITAAVIVTTPQELSFADVVRGIEMFDSVEVPCVAVVENMAYYQPSADSATPPAVDKEMLKSAFTEQLKAEGLQVNGGGDSAVDKLAQSLVDTVVQQQEQKSSSSELPDPVYIFGPGHVQRLSEQWGIEHTFSMPLLDRISANGDSGTPYVLEFPDSPQAHIYSDLAKSVVSEVAKVKYASKRPGIVYDEEQHVLSVDGDASLSPAALRRACRCAACVEELTGRQILVASSVPDTIQPRKLSPTGNYALSVDWSDGHKSLYPYRQIRSLLQEKQETKKKVL